MSVKEDLLMELLDCGFANLELLDDVSYPVNEILEQLSYPFGRESFTLNDFMKAVVDLGILDIKDTIEERLNELSEIAKDRDLDDSEVEELRCLQNVLDPYDDISGFFNCLDTHVSFRDHEEEYRRYLSDAITAFEENTGLNFC